MPTLPSAPAMFRAFAKAGLLVPAAWSPQPGGEAVQGQVDYRAPTLDGAGAIVQATTAQWPRGQFPGARRGDRLDIEVEPGEVLVYKLREVHRAADGDEILVELGAWA